jgi:hypothetical protein
MTAVEQYHASNDVTVLQEDDRYSFTHKQGFTAAISL